jgi:hypothetical protein
MIAMLSQLASGAVMGAVKGGMGVKATGARGHRRRKALTKGDLADALTIASAISKKAAENYILIRARRS